ncbi:hypothetical protein SteCoe_27014 [Stentor coeruleus]|uniref:Uncharacterized protein n=1 Tax=Stentor coeruleus TaxID=5963 RepID=A0A1R2BBK3_9CILI|nr:hypothetical protein SteCoe_27014 [Stentor coeruleus]
MRATDLGFRSPKEKTAEFYSPTVTFDGRVLPILHQNAHPTFSRSRRFSQYELEARKTGVKAGPGAYNLIQNPGREWHISGTPLYKTLHGNVDTGDNGYIFVGNSLLYEPSFVSNRKQSLKEHSVDGVFFKESTRKSSSMKNSEEIYQELEIRDKVFSKRSQENKATEHTDNTKETYRDGVKKLNEKKRFKSALGRPRTVNDRYTRSPYIMDKTNKIVNKVNENQVKTSL